MVEHYFKIPLLRKIVDFSESENGRELKRLLPLADTWDGDAQARVGQILREGLDGVPVDLIEAAKWTDLAARTRNHDACVALQAMIDAHGWEIVGEGKRRAFRWQQERSNAEDGWPPEAPDDIMSCLDATSPAGSFFVIGAMLNDGEELPFDFEKSFRFFQMGAERDGCLHSTFNVGHAYYCGKGVRADPVQAIEWFNKASARGYAKATFQLGILALRGHGMPEDRTAALDSLREAERQGHPDAATIIQAIQDGATFY